VEVDMPVSAAGKPFSVYLLKIQQSPAVRLLTGQYRNSGIHVQSCHCHAQPLQPRFSAA
jgi:hypothetical protein